MKFMGILALSGLLSVLLAGQCSSESRIYSLGYETGVEEPDGSIYYYKAYCETICQAEAMQTNKSFSACTTLCFAGIGDGSKKSKPKKALCK